MPPDPRSTRSPQLAALHQPRVGDAWLWDIAVNAKTHGGLARFWIRFAVTVLVQTIFNTSALP